MMYYQDVLSIYDTNQFMTYIRYEAYQNLANVIANIGIGPGKSDSPV